MSDSMRPRDRGGPFVHASVAGVATLIVLAATGQSLAWALFPMLMVLAASLFWSWRPLDAGLERPTPASEPPPPTPAIPPDARPAEPRAVPGVALIEAFALPLVVTGPNEIVEASSASGRLIFPGLSPGRPISLAIRDPDYLDALKEVAADGVLRSIVLTQGAPLTRVMRVHVSRFGAGEEGGVASVFEDLTEQRATERMRVDFIANASHELRTPLASLLGFIETLQGPARDDAKARERFLPIMREQASRMARLIDDLLSLSRAELKAHQVPTGEIDLRVIVREILDSLGLSARERGVTLRAALPDEPAPILGDRDDLLRMVENLVENAIRYGREGEHVDIAVETTADGVVLSVTDHGPGIAAVHIPRLTERFYRADASHSREIGGTGLGLAIVKHLVMRHRARLDIDSKLGEGATFRVNFPRSPG